MAINNRTEETLKDIATFNDFQALELKKLNTNLELQRQQLKRIVNVNNTSLKNINKNLEEMNENLKQ